jgi:hypothetical protein
VPSSDRKNSSITTHTSLENEETRRIDEKRQKELFIIHSFVTLFIPNAMV